MSTRGAAILSFQVGLLPAGGACDEQLKTDYWVDAAVLLVRNGHLDCVYRRKRLIWIRNIKEIES